MQFRFGTGGGSGVRAQIGHGGVLSNLIIPAAIVIGVIILVILIVLVVREYNLHKKLKKQ
jgi:hypothetical protein